MNAKAGLRKKQTYKNGGRIRKIIMLFRLFLTDRQLYFDNLGVIGKNGEMYFSAVDVAYVIGQRGVRGWAARMSSCLLGEILNVDRSIEYCWVIELTALVHLLTYRMASGHKADKEKRLYELRPCM